MLRASRAARCRPAPPVALGRVQRERCFPRTHWEHLILISRGIQPCNWGWKKAVLRIPALFLPQLLFPSGKIGSSIRFTGKNKTCAPTMGSSSDMWL